MACNCLFKPWRWVVVVGGVVFESTKVLDRKIFGDSCQIKQNTCSTTSQSWKFGPFIAPDCITIYLVFGNFIFDRYSSKQCHADIIFFLGKMHVKKQMSFLSIENYWLIPRPADLTTRYQYYMPISRSRVVAHQNN